MGASLALGVTPGGTPLAHAANEGSAPTPAQAQPKAQTQAQAQPQKPSDAQGSGAQAHNTPKKETPKAVAPNANAANSVKKPATQDASSTQDAKNPVPVTNLMAKEGAQGTNANAQNAPIGTDRDATTNQGKQANSEVTLSKETKDTLPNMYAWGSSNNMYVKEGQDNAVKFILKPSDGVAVTKVAIYPNDNIDVNSEKAKKYVEYRSDDDKQYQVYSGTYDLVKNGDGSAVLTMSKLYRDGKLNSGQSYAANRCIYVFGMKDGQEVLLYKTNIARAATLIPPKKVGSIVLRYDQKLEEKDIREKLQKALDAPTEAKDKKTLQPLSVKDQIAAASQEFGVGVRDKNDNRKLDNTADDPEKKIVITDKNAYTPGELAKINEVTSEADAKEKTYVTGVKNLKTYLVSDLGYKSDAMALTVARYDTRIVKPIVEDPTKVPDDVKKEIAKKLAKLNHIPQDKVTVNADGTVTINFEGVDPSLAPTLNLSDLVLKQLNEADVKVPSDAEDSKVKAVVVANPLGYSNAELDQIKQAIYEANKDNQKLGLTSKDQISLGWISGNLTQTGDTTKGISNGQSENTITVTIKTDKAYAQFKSDIKEHKLTRLVNLRTDYKLSWEANKNKIDGRTSDEGLAWMEDGKTLVYRYDSDSGTTFNTEDVLKLLKATLKDDLKKDNPQMRTEILGSEYKTVAREGINGKETRSHAGYAIDDKGNPIGVLNLTKLNGSSYGGFAKPVDNSDKKMGDEQSSVNKFTFDTESKAAEVAGKSGKCMIGRLFIEPYTQYQYNYVYGEGKYNPRTSPKGINVVFVPQTKHKTKDLSKSIGEHKLADDQKTPTEAKYYNASDAKKKAYDDALKEANEALKEAGNTEDSKLSEDLKARIDNATINLNKARAELDGPDTNKDKLSDSIKANGTPAKEGAAATGTQATNQFKNVSNPDFKTPEGKTDEARNNAAKEAKKAYDEALAAAEKVKADDNATQKAVDAAKAKLDAARAKLNDFTTNKDELSAAIAKDGKVNTGRDAQGTQTLSKADPTYQNSSKDEQKAYDDAVAQADKVSKDVNASQKEVNEAIKKLKEAKAALDANATDKSPLDAAVQKSLDNDSTKHSVFYTNAKNKTNDPAAKKAVEDYDKALAEAKRVLDDKNATKADVEKAKKDLEDAEKVLYADTYQTKTTDLAQALVDNFGGYLMPAYFNAFDEAQAKGKDSQAAKDFKAYNDAYHAAKDLMAKTKQPGSTVKQNEVDNVKKQLIEARKAIDKYATDTSKISAALLHSLAIKASPAYQNASANTDPNSDEAKAKKAYDDALSELQKAFNDQMDKDKGDDGNEIPESVIPDKTIDMTNKDALKKLQAHAKGQPLNRDLTKLLAKLNDAVKGLDKFKTKTDDLIKSINEDATTHPSPAFKNASQPNYQKPDGSGPDDTKNAAARKAASDYGQALNEAKDLLNNPNATQKDINDAKDKLDKARKALDDYKTDVSKLQESANKHGKEKQGDTAATEGTVTSDAYRNASDPHFMKEEGGKLVPDDDKNKKAAEDKKAYDEALTKAQELLKKHDDKAAPQDAKPTQAEIDAALKTLNEKRQALDTYKTNTDALSAEAAKSKADTAQTVGENDFENTPEFKNASYKQSVKPDTDPDVQQAKSDIDAYKKALKDARDLLAKKNSTTLSERPTQKEIDDALEALKNAKQAITDGYKTDTSKLNEAKVYANGDFKKTPEYKNAAALKDDQEADQTKKDAAKKAVDALDENTNDSALKKAMDIVANPTGKTQKEVDEALKTLQDAMSKVTDNHKTDVKPLQNEVGDKDKDGKDVIPPFEATVEYKNALNKQNSGDADAIAKLKAYADKVKDAQKLIDKVANPDPNAKPEDRPTQAKVDEALKALKQAKKDITDKFKTNAKDLKKETNELKDDGGAKPDSEKFENSTEYNNALNKKGDDGKDIEDVQTYKAALTKANNLLNKFDENGNPKPGEKDIPTQQEVDEAQKALKEIKDKILANYKTSSTPLQMEVDKSKDGKDDKRDDVFENTPAFKNADAVKGEDGKDNPDIKRYKEALDAAKALLDKFDRTTGKPKTPPAGEKAPTQKQLDDALKALQDAKAAIIKYDTTAQALRDAVNSDFTSTQPYQNVLASWGAADISKNPYVAKYLEALNAAKAVLDRHYGNYDAKYKPTQKEVNEALAKLKLAEKELSDAYNEPHAFLDPQTYGNTPSGGGAGAAGAGAGVAPGANAGDAGAHDANKQNEGAHANHDGNHDTNATDTTVHQPQHAAHNNANADANANAAANANVAADALGTGAAQAPDGSKASKDTNINNARLPKTSDALPLYANSAAVLVAIAVLTRTNRRRKKNRL